MRTLILTALIVGCSTICNAQEKPPDTTKVKFTPPVIVKEETAKTETKEVVKFTPPVIVKGKTPKNKKKRKG